MKADFGDPSHHPRIAAVCVGAGSVAPHLALTGSGARGGGGKVLRNVLAVCARF